MEMLDHLAYVANWLLPGAVRRVRDKTISRELDQWRVCQVLRDDIDVTFEQRKQVAVLRCCPW